MCLLCDQETVPSNPLDKNVLPFYPFGLLQCQKTLMSLFWIILSSYFSKGILILSKTQVRIPIKSPEVSKRNLKPKTFFPQNFAQFKVKLLKMCFYSIVCLWVFKLILLFSICKIILGRVKTLFFCKDRIMY